jgi:hypothetical protein
MTKFIIFSISFLLGVILPANAQLVKQKVGGDAKHQLTLFGGINFPSFDIPHSIGPSAALAYSYFFMPQIGIRGMLHYHYFDGEKNVPSIYSHNMGIGVQGIFNFFSYQSGRPEDAGFSIIPSKAYLAAGVGGLLHQAYVDGNTQQNELSFSIPVGIGTRHPIARRWDLGVEFGWNVTSSDMLDQVAIAESTNDSFGNLFLTATYKIPKHNYGPTRGKQFQNRKTKKCDKRKGCAVAFD